MISISAPAKLMIIGEYAVLEGGPAVVTAVNRRVRLRCSPRVCDDSTPDIDASLNYPQKRPEVVLTQQLAQQKFGLRLSQMQLDTAELEANERKLGLGSSAAAAVATAAATGVAAGLDLSAAADKAQIFDLAKMGHRALAPHGSGADIAAAVYGGTLLFQLAEPKPIVTDLPWPEGLRMSVVWTTVSARTSDFLTELVSFKAGHPASYAQCQRDLSEASQAFIDAFKVANIANVLHATRDFVHVLQLLDSASGLGLITPEIAKICNLADRHGGAGKPSGAGGGDVCIAFFQTVQSQAAFEAACRRDNFLPLAISWSERGVCLD